MLLSIALAISRLGHQQVCIPYGKVGSVHQTVLRTAENLAQVSLLLEKLGEF